MVWHVLGTSLSQRECVGGAPSRASQIVKVKDIVRLRPNDNKTSWALVQLPKVQGQLIALNPNNGAD